MKEFGRYEVLDVMERLVSYGHKASFCLEDNRCEKNATKHFYCSNVMDTKGKQGASYLPVRPNRRRRALIYLQVITF